MAQPEVSILIDNGGVTSETHQCIESLIARTRGIRFEVLVTDSGTDVIGLTALEALAPGVRVLRLGIGRANGEARNYAAEHAAGRFLCSMSRCASVSPGWLQPLVGALVADPSAAIAGPLMLMSDGSVMEAGGTIDQAGYPVRYGRGLRDADLGVTSRRDVDCVSDLCMLIRRELFFEAGGFDLAFEPEFYHDADLCLKLRGLGYKVITVPSARVTRGDGAAALFSAEENIGLPLAELNREKFRRRWSAFLASRDPRDLVKPAADNSRGIVQGPSYRAEVRKTVVIYTPYDLTPGGGERVLLTIGSILSARRDVMLVTTHPFSKVRLGAMGRAMGLDVSRITLQSLSDVESTSEFDIFLSMNNHSLPACRALGRRNYFLCQFPFPAAPHVMAACMPLAAGYDVALCYSDFARAHLVAAMNAHQLPAWPVEILYPPVPQMEGSPGEKRPIILSVGRFFGGPHRKRHDLLIGVFRGLIERGAQGIELHLAGSSPGGSAYLQELAECAAGLPVHFHVNPSSETLATLYREAAVYWHGTGFQADLVQDPGAAEHFGISIVEGMSAGCIAMAYNAGGAREVITSGVDGYLYSTADELGRWTVEVLSGEPGPRIAMGLAAIRRAGQFSATVFEARVQALFAA